MFTSEVQFGHAGACANAERETADAKNQASHSEFRIYFMGAVGDLLPVLPPKPDCPNVYSGTPLIQTRHHWDRRKCPD